MATKPTASQLEQASLLPPNARSWVKTYVDERLERISGALAAKIEAQLSTPTSGVNACSCASRVDDLARRIEYLEAIKNDDERYSLTKAKVVELLKKHGIE